MPQDTMEKSAIGKTAFEKPAPAGALDPSNAGLIDRTAPAIDTPASAMDMKAPARVRPEGGLGSSFLRNFSCNAAASAA